MSGLVCRDIDGVLHDKGWIFVVYVGRVFIVVVDDFHNEGDEGIDEDVPALVVVAPNLEQIQQLLTYLTLVVVGLEQLQ